MYKLLIVDDEYLVREGLRTTVDWAQLDIDVVGTAENGKQGLELAREIKPDLIIADVRMPVFDGLDMAKELFNENADLAVIIYSGYKDFENARRALDSGVAGFLLKPIENENLIQRVREVLQKLEEKRRNNQMLGQFVTNMALVRQQQFEILLRNPQDADAASEQLKLLGVCLPSEGTLLYSHTDSTYIKTFTKHCEKYLSTAEFVSEEFKNSAVFLVAASEKDVLRLLDGLLDELIKVTDARFSVATCAFNGNIAGAFATAERLSENTLFTAINAIATDEYGGKYKKLIRDALKIIETQYHTKLSVKSVAETLYISESHLMHEFKEQVGKTFNECLTDFRMLKAQELLLKGDQRVGEVAYSVGYTDVKYFSQVFREYAGCIPSEYAGRKKR